VLSPSRYVPCLRLALNVLLTVSCILHFLRLSSAVLAKVSEEVAALQASAAAAAAAAAEAGGEEGAAGPGVSELLKPARESAAVLKEVWNPMVSKACGQGKCCMSFSCCL
jgi:hypothetical protein